MSEKFKFVNGEIDILNSVEELHARFDDFHLVQSRQGDKLDRCEDFMKTVADNIGNLSVLTDIKNEIHDLRDSLIKPIIKVFTWVSLGFCALFVVVVAVAIGIRSIDVSPTGGVHYNTDSEK